MQEYCNFCVVVMKKFVQLILRFHWIKSPWIRIHIFWYNPLSRKMVALFVNIDEWQKRKLLQRSYCKVTSFSLQRFPVRFSWEFKPFSFFGKFLTYSNIIFLNTRITALLSVTTTILQARSVPWPRALFLGTDRRTSNYCIIIAQ